MNLFYRIDDEGHVVPEPDAAAWEAWYREHGRVTMQEMVGTVTVSTVFLGLSVEDPPRLWETMIFGGEHDQYQERYETRAEAEAGHARALQMVKAVRRIEFEE